MSFKSGGKNPNEKMKQLVRFDKTIGVPLTFHKIVEKRGQKNTSYKRKAGREGRKGWNRMQEDQDKKKANHNGRKEDAGPLLRKGALRVAVFGGGGRGGGNQKLDYRESEEE